MIKCQGLLGFQLPYMRSSEQITETSSQGTLTVSLVKVYLYSIIHPSRACDKFCLSQYDLTIQNVIKLTEGRCKWL